ncbi:MAG TPA: hypothetical protein VJ323_04595, partial [Bryobacteraceae bacterium]|nr:hypothetical protein [Bryobacteraceae bacterium]
RFGASDGLPHAGGASKSVIPARARFRLTFDRISDSFGGAALGYVSRRRTSKARANDVFENWPE